MTPNFDESHLFDVVSIVEPQIKLIRFLCCDFAFSSTVEQGLLLPEKLGHGLDFPDVTGGLELDKLLARIAGKKGRLVGFVL